MVTATFTGLSVDNSPPRHQKWWKAPHSCRSVPSFIVHHCIWNARSHFQNPGHGEINIDYERDPVGNMIFGFPVVKAKSGVSRCHGSIMNCRWYSGAGMKGTAVPTPSTDAAVPAPGGSMSEWSVTAIHRAEPRGNAHRHWWVKTGTRIIRWWMVMVYDD